MSDYGLARSNMIEGQLRTNKVTDPDLLEAFATVAREAFVPEALRGAAYTDEHLSLGGGRYLLEPLVTARLIQAAAVAKTDKVLHVGGGTGYASAILAQLAASVIMVESDAALAAKAGTALAGIANVTVRHAALGDGAAQDAPFDVIFIDGAVTEAPAGLVAQLRLGGRLVTVLRSASSLVGRGVLLERLAAGLPCRVLFESGAKLLPGLVPEPAFCL